MTLLKPLTKDTKKLLGLGVGIGVGAGILGAVGQKAGVNVSGGLATAAGFVPIVTTGVLGYQTLRLVDNLYVKKLKY